MTTAAITDSPQEKSARKRPDHAQGNVLLCAALTPLAIVVHGYHPYAEDGGIYLAGIKYLLNPQLFPRFTGFVTAHLQFSVFAHVIALLVRATGTGVMSTMLLLHLAAVFLTLYSASLLIDGIVQDKTACYSAVLLLAAALSMPVAGTSLMLADPYVTARSFALPCVLLGITGMLRAFTASQGGRSVLPGLVGAVCAIAAAIALHPLTGGYGAAVMLLFGAGTLPTKRMRTLATGLLVVAAFGLALLVNTIGQTQPAGYATIARTRAYWFLSHWTWYELMGLVAPLLILLWFRTRRETSAAASALIAATSGAAVIGTTVALLFAHFNGPGYAVARLQPLRVFQLVYVLMLLCLGVLLRTVLRNTIARAALCIAVAAVLFATARGLYAHSRHLELPWNAPRNAWQQAFLWVRQNTPWNAVVALDAGYIESPGEDAQNFRAISERAMPADFSKDGGIAAIRPALSRDWTDGVQLQRNLNTVPDQQRIAALSAAKIDWVVLPTAVRTRLVCPFHNQTVKVCRVA